MGALDRWAKKREVPHVYVIVTCLVLISVLSTYFVPAGEYVRGINPNTGQNIVDPNSFHLVPQQPVNPLMIPSYMVQAFSSKASIIFMLIASAGGVEAVIGTGAFEKGINWLLKRMKDKERQLMVILMFFFGLLGFRMNPVSFIGFLPVIILLCRNCGYDAIVAVSVIMLSSGATSSVGPLVPFTTAIAQEIAQLPIFSGFELRMVLSLAYVALTAVLTLRYGEMVRKHPEKSYVYALGAGGGTSSASLLAEARTSDAQLTKRQIAVLIIFGLSFVITAWGGIVNNWGNDEVSIQFIWLAVLGGLVGGRTPSQIAADFTTGAKRMISPIMVLTIAACISVVLTQGFVIDTVVNAMFSVLRHIPMLLLGPAMFIFNTLVNVLITSGSGQAMAVMPLLTPLADMLGMTRQTMVLAFGLGDGLSNYLLPTSFTLTSFILVAGIEFTSWLKYMIKMFAAWVALAMAAMVIAQYTNYGAS